LHLLNLVPNYEAIVKPRYKGNLVRILSSQSGSARDCSDSFTKHETIIAQAQTSAACRPAKELGFPRLPEYIQKQFDIDKSFMLLEAIPINTSKISDLSFWRFMISKI